MKDDTDTAQRSKCIDVLKGLAIFFVVLGHSPYLIHISPKVFNVIFSFHIPLFIFIAGYLFTPNTTGITMVRKRFKSLLMPYIFTIIIIILAYSLFKQNRSFNWYIFWALYGNGPNLPKLALHLWFLPHLFLVSVLIWLLFRYISPLKETIILQILLILVLILAGAFTIGCFWNFTIPISLTNTFIADVNILLLNGQLENPAYLNIPTTDANKFIFKGLPWSLDITLVSAAFLLLGYFTKRNKIEKIFHKHSMTLLAFVLFVTLHYFFNYTIDLNLRRYDHCLISTLLACTGIYLCIYAACMITNTNNVLSGTLQYMGRYSLIIYIFHLFIQSKIYFAILAILPNKVFIAFLSALATGIGLPLILNYIALEKFKFFRFWYYSR